jgi:hypothetical protein
MKASSSDHPIKPRRLPFNIFGMPKFDIYRDYGEEKEPRKDI